jgi:hypothetical protein
VEQQPNAQHSEAEAAEERKHQFSSGRAG